MPPQNTQTRQTNLFRPHRRLSFGLVPVAQGNACFKERRDARPLCTHVAHHRCVCGDDIKQPESPKQTAGMVVQRCPTQTDTRIDTLPIPCFDDSGSWWGPGPIGRGRTGRPSCFGDFSHCRRKDRKPIVGFKHRHPLKALCKHIRAARPANR